MHLQTGPGLDPNQDGKAILSEELTLAHPIHLQSFSGGQRVAELWVSYFRRAYFGVSTLTLNQDTSREALSWMGLSRLVLEMDSPHLVLTGLPYNDLQSPLAVRPSGPASS